MDGHRSFKRGSEILHIACRRSVVVGEMIQSLVAVCEGERHRFRQRVCADVRHVVVVDVLFGHSADLVIDDVDVSAVVSACAHKRIGDCRIAVGVGECVLERRFVKHKQAVNDGAVKHRDGHVDRLSCEHIGCLGCESKVLVAGLCNHILDVLVDCHVFFLAVFVNVLIDIAAESVFNADDRVDDEGRIALAALDELVNARPVEVCLEHVFVHSAKDGCHVKLSWQIARIFFDERIHNDGAICMVGDEHDCSVCDIHFDLACLVHHVCAAEVGVGDVEFDLLAEELGDVVVEVLLALEGRVCVFERVACKHFLRQTAAVDKDVLHSAGRKERAFDRVRIENELRSACKCRDACACHIDVDVELASEIIVACRHGHFARKAGCGVGLIPRHVDSDALVCDLDLCRARQSAVELVGCERVSESACEVARESCRIVNKREVVVDCEGEILSPAAVFNAEFRAERHDVRLSCE